jgi:hypothetical protein
MLGRGVELRTWRRASRSPRCSTGCRAPTPTSARADRGGAAQDAHVVITGRSTDTALTYAPMIHEFGWAGTTSTGSRPASWRGTSTSAARRRPGATAWPTGATIPDLANVGYPIIEAYPDGSFVVTKHDGHRRPRLGATVKEQLLYEMGDPKELHHPGRGRGLHHHPPGGPTARTACGCTACAAAHGPTCSR